MRRREFCKLAAAAAAGTAIAGTASAEDPKPFSTPDTTATPLSAAAAAQEAGVAVGFGQVTQTYAEFCQTPAQDRVFYTLEDGKIIS
jgi:hypothetical protein